MADEEQLAIIRRGVDEWNTWRRSQSASRVDLCGAPLGDVKLPGVDFQAAALDGIRLRWAYMRGALLQGASLCKADLRIIDLSKADLRGADLSGANLAGAYLREADLRGATLRGANLTGVNFNRANLSDANLTDAALMNTLLVDVDLSRATLVGCRVYGTAAWNVNVSDADQRNLIVTPPKQPEITVDNLKVAQFIYLLLNNSEIREVIDTIGRKAVLILGRFTPKRKPVLDAIRDELRKHDYLPIMFDFEKPEGRNYTETVSTLAHMARFIIADVTDALVVLQELERIVPKLPSVPVQPILEQGAKKNLIVGDFEDYPWFLEMYRYKNLTDVCASLTKKIIGPAEAKAMQIEERRKVRDEEDRSV